MPRYLEKRRRRWYAVLEVPKRLKGIIGKDRFVQSLGTESQTEAERLVLSVVARWKTEIEAARSGTPISHEVLAQEWAKDWAMTSDPELRDVYSELLEDKVKKLADQNTKLADTFSKVVTGQTEDIREYVEEWLSGQHNVSKTIDMKRADVSRFLKTFSYSHEVSKTVVQKWVDDLMKADGISSATARRYVSSCRGYWSFLQRSGYINREDDPFHDAVERRSKKTKSTFKGKRKAFSPSEVVTLLNATDVKHDPTLANLIRLAMWSGCRIEELCSLKVDDVRDGYFSVVNAKTEAGNRKVPIHSKLRPYIEKFCSSSSDGYVLDGLSFNKYGDRSNAIGKRFGRLKTDLGFGPELVFHSIRKTVATLFENAEVLENISADILGHDKKTMTYGVYSGGATIEAMQRAIEHLSYPLMNSEKPENKHHLSQEYQ